MQVAGFKLSPSESAFMTQNVYADFISDYFHKHDLREALRAIPRDERAARESDPRFDYVVAQSVISKFFVLPSSYLYDNEYTHQSDTSSSSSSASSSSDIKRTAGRADSSNRYKLLQKGSANSKTEGSSSGSGSSGSNSGGDGGVSLSQLLSSTMSPLALPLSTGVAANSDSIVPTLSDRSGSGSGSSITPGAVFKLDASSKSSTSAAVASVTSQSSPSRSSSSQQQWESELFSLKRSKQSTKLSSDKIFSDFKAFVMKKVSANELNIGIGDSEAKIKELIQEFKSQGKTFDAKTCVLLTM